MSLHESYRVTRPDTLRPPLIEAVCKSARSVGTPFWLYETEPMRQRVRQLRAFDCIRFAQKANSDIHILRILRAMGVLVDAVSFGESERAVRARYVPGTAAHEIVFTADVIDEATGLFSMPHFISRTSLRLRNWRICLPGRLTGSFSGSA